MILQVKNSKKTLKINVSKKQNILAQKMKNKIKGFQQKSNLAQNIQIKSIIHENQVVYKFTKKVQIKIKNVPQVCFYKKTTR